MAILNFTVFRLFATPPWKCIQKFPKVFQMIFGLSRTEMTEQIFIYLSLFKSYEIVNDKVNPEYVRKLLSRSNFDQSKRNLLCFINAMIWGSMPKLGTAPPMGIEMEKKITYLLITLHYFVVMVNTSSLTNFWISRTNSLAPPPVQKPNIEIIIAHEPLILEKWNLVHLMTLIMLITFNSLQ